MCDANTFGISELIPYETGCKAFYFMEKTRSVESAIKMKHLLERGDMQLVRVFFWQYGNVTLKELSEDIDRMVSEGILSKDPLNFSLLTMLNTECNGEYHFICCFTVIKLLLYFSE